MPSRILLLSDPLPGEDLVVGQRTQCESAWDCCSLAYVSPVAVRLADQLAGCIVLCSMCQSCCAVQCP
jgi:hypothetical protein